MIDSCGHYVDSEVYKYMNRFDLGLDDLVNYKGEIQSIPEWNSATVCGIQYELCLPIELLIKLKLVRQRIIFMDYNEFMEILEKENLNNISFNEKNLLSDTVYFLRKNDGFVVYTTDERTSVFGKIRNFQNAEDAYRNVLKRLRAFKS